MSAFETELRKFKMEMKLEIQGLRKLVVTRLAIDKWVQQDVACALLHVKQRRLRDIRKHVDKKSGRSVGDIGWKKGKGKNVLYYLPDIEKYNSAFTIMN